MTPPVDLLLDDSAALWSAPVATLGDRPLVLLLHGRGADEHDLFSLVSRLPRDAVYLSLRAPHPLGSGWSWFLPGTPGLPDPASARQATAAVLALLDRVTPSGPVSVVGFSQGGAMATQLLRHAPERFASFVVLAGFSIDGGELSGAAEAVLKTVRKPVFWGRDPADPVIPADAIARTQEWLPAHSLATVREYPGVGHSISQEEIDDVAVFLANTLYASDL